MTIDYDLVLRIINTAEDPPAALRVMQEREDAAHKATQVRA